MVLPGKPLGIWRRGNKGKIGIGVGDKETGKLVGRDGRIAVTRSSLFQRLAGNLA